MGYLNQGYLSGPYLQESSMVDRSKIIFVNTDGDYEETSSADSLQFASFKTANYELTDALLGDVTNKMIKSDGSRAFAAAQSMGGFKLTNLANGTVASDAVNYGQLLAVQNGVYMKEPARAATTAALPAVTYANGSSGVGATLTANANGALPAQDGVTLIVGDRLLVKDQVAGLQNGIYEVTAVGDGSNPFVLTRVVDFDQDAEIKAGTLVPIEEGTVQDNYLYQLITNNPITTGTTALVFNSVPFNTFTEGNGIDIVGAQISVDFATGGGLKFIGNELAVEPSDFAGEGLVDDGSDNLAIDWSTAYNDSKAVKASDLSSTATGKGASIIGIEDAGGYFAADDVEGALAELAASSGGASYTVGAGGVTKGDLVYLSANNTVSKMPINANHEAIGLALATVAAAGSVQVQGFDYVIPGALSGATAGVRYYWNGSALSTSIPSGGGSYVWVAGVAKNATDLVAMVEFIKKNS
jgi:hypothetical protein